MIRGAKSLLETVFKVRIYRYAVPHGTDFLLDLQKMFGSPNFRVIFDVGANIGQTAVSYLRDFPIATIYSFEPVPSTYRHLEHLARTQPRLRTFCCAMGKERGSAIININPDSRTNSIINHRPGDRQESIQVDTIARFASEQRLDKIDFLKIDTEGFELEVLEGAAPMLEQQSLKVVLAECGPSPQDSYFVSLSALTEFFSKYNYALFGIYDQQPHWDGKKHLKYFSAVFICPTLSIGVSPIPW